MSRVIGKSRLGLVVIKLSVGSEPFFLMRLNAKWKDVNFIGGHEKERDGQNLGRTARRELWEEVPPVRGRDDFTLEPLTQVVHYGPILSRSRGNEVEYELQFFLLKIGQSPAGLADMFSSRTKNIWVSERDLMSQRRFRVSGLVTLLDSLFPGGLSAIPYSSPVDLHFMRDRFVDTSGKQIEFALK
jgi:hypothetical protein